MNLSAEKVDGMIEGCKLPRPAARLLPPAACYAASQPRPSPTTRPALASKVHEEARVLLLDVAEVAAEVLNILLNLTFAAAHLRAR